MTLNDLRREYEEELVGELIYGRIRIHIESLLRLRDPLIYARGAHDYRDALDDVVNDFALEVLIRERQIDYVVSTSSTVDDFDRILLYQARRYLARTRRRTIVDNLIDRSLNVLRQAPFRSLGGRGATEVFALEEKSYATSAEPTDAEIRVASSLAQIVQRIVPRGTEREPKVYETDDLFSVLRILLDTVSGPVTRRHLQGFLENLLTSWLPNLLDLSDEVQLQDPGLSPDEETVVAQMGKELARGMTQEERTIFQFKHANLPDRELASRLRMSRQSVAPRKASLFERLRDDLAALSAPMQMSVLAHIAHEISRFERDLT